MTDTPIAKPATAARQYLGGWKAPVFGTVVVAVVGGYLWTWWDGGEAAPDTRGGPAATSAVYPGAPAVPRAAPAVPPRAEPTADRAPEAARQVAAPTIPAAAFIAPMAISRRGGGTQRPEGAATASAAPEPQEEDRSDLAAALRPSRQRGARSSRIANRAYVVVPGTPIVGTLETSVDSTQSARIVCRTKAAVFGDTGTVEVIPASSVITGTTTRMSQGQARIFITAGTAYTGDGRRIDIDSAMTDPMGRGGLDGAVDNHTGRRILSALVMGLSGDAISYGSREAGIGGGSRTGRDLENAVTGSRREIPPTLRKEAGEPCGITVDRELDFSPDIQVRTR